METARSRFLRYVTYYTTSDEHTGASPSTERQKDLGRVLLAELESLGLAGAHMDGAGNVIATLPAAAGVTAPVLALIAHMDTSPDASGENVKPRIVRYEGGDLPLSDAVSLTESLCPGLSAHVGEELIVTDGTTLLGADDKAGIAEIMAAVELLEGRPHGEVRVVFTTDEEIGCGVDGLDVAELACDYGYTVDGGPLGEIEYENFNAASGDVTFRGVGVHPGSAKDVMVNAATVAMAFHAMLPTDEVPEKTDGYQGFFHLHAMSGDVTEAQLHYIIRDHDRDRFEARKALFHRCADAINAQYGPGTASAVTTDSYYNMKEKVRPPHGPDPSGRGCLPQKRCDAAVRPHPRRHRRRAAVLGRAALPQSFHRRLQLPRRAGVDTRRQSGRHGRRAGGSGVRLRAVNRGVSPPLFG